MSLLLFIGYISTEFLCGPCCFLLVHCVNSWFLLVHCSSSNVVFKIAKRPFEDRKEKVKFDADFEDISNNYYFSQMFYFNNVENCNEHSSTTKPVLFGPRSIHYCQNIRILSREPSPITWMFRRMKYKKEMKLKGVEVDTTPPPPQARHCASPSHVSACFLRY